ncbi:MAG: hypothetical protein KAH23_09910, partial [Kiritimatiellae bacterium]|nr:hypothetical protein [Kiritimatiellia bacterium]
VMLVLCSVQLANAGDVAATVKLGTLGYGADVTFDMTELYNFRVGFNMFSYEPDISGDDEEDGPEDIQLELDWQTIAASFDLHPWENGFRFTAGLIINNNEIILTAEAGEEVEINDRSYRVADLQGSVTFDQLAPYLGIGFGNAIDREGRWSFAMDLGVMFQGSPEVDITAHVLGGDQAALDAALEEEEKEIEDDISGLNIYPVLSFGVSFRF